MVPEDMHAPYAGLHGGQAFSADRKDSETEIGAELLHILQMLSRYLSRDPVVSSATRCIE